MDAKSTMKDSTKPVFYEPTITSLDPSIQKILERNGVDASQALTHVQQLRDRAWEKFPYPCIGMFAFVRPLMSTVPCYRSIVDRLTTKDNENEKNTWKLLDLGCGFGQDIRNLIYIEGVPAVNVVGLDENDGFVELGFELFRDRATLGTRFVFADVTADNLSPDLHARFDVIYAGMLFHLWGWEGQKHVIRNTISLLKPVAGAVVFGFQLGSIEPGEYAFSGVPSGCIFKHDVVSLRKLWDEVGAETGTRWEVEAWMEGEGPEIEMMRRLDSRHRRIDFSIVRL